MTGWTVFRSWTSLPYMIIFPTVLKEEEVSEEEVENEEEEEEEEEEFEEEEEEETYPPLLEIVRIPEQQVGESFGYWSDSWAEWPDGR